MGFDEKIKTAARDLGESLSDWPPIFSVGIGVENGRSVLVVHLKRRVRDFQVPSEWEGYPVRTDYEGTIRPIPRV